MTVITTILTIFTAIVATLIAYGQYSISNYRIKMDLFDKRFDFILNFEVF